MELWLLIIEILVGFGCVFVSVSIISRFLRTKGLPILPEVENDLFSKKQIYQYAISLIDRGLSSPQVRNELVLKGLDINSAHAIAESLETIEIQGEHYHWASLMERWVARFLDGLICLTISLVLAFLFSFVTESAVVVFIGRVLAILYLLFPGQSVGQRIVKIKVIDSRTGASCTFEQHFVRNLLLNVSSR